MTDSADRVHLVCSCSYHDHTIVLTHWPDDFDAIYVDVRMTPVVSPWRRVVVAWHVLLGLPVCGFGPWAESIVDNPVEARKVAALFTRLADSKESRTG